MSYFKAKKHEELPQTPSWIYGKGMEGRKDGREGRGRSERGGEGQEGENRGKNHTGSLSPLRVLTMVNLKSLIS